MVALQTHNNSGRKKLVITKAPEAKQITGKDNKPLDFIEFMAKVEGEDLSVKYSVWSKALNDYFKLDAVVDCDVVVTDQKNLDQDGNPYKNRKITQVYQDGSPVKQQQKQWGKSPETVAMELDSKARNTALMQACEFVDSPDATVENVLSCADRFYAWLKGESTKVPDKPVVKESVGKPQQEATLPIVERPSDRPEGMPASITDRNKMAAYAGKHGISAAEFMAIVQSPPNEIKTPEQLHAAWNVLAPKMKGK